MKTQWLFILNTFNQLECDFRHINSNNMYILFNNIHAMWQIYSLFKARSQFMYMLANYCWWIGMKWYWDSLGKVKNIGRWCRWWNIESIFVEIWKYVWITINKYHIQLCVKSTKMKRVWFQYGHKISDCAWVSVWTTIGCVGCFFETILCLSFLWSAKFVTSISYIVFNFLFAHEIQSFRNWTKRIFFLPNISKHKTHAFVNDITNFTYIIQDMSRLQFLLIYN